MLFLLATAAFWITLLGGGGYMLLRFVRAYELNAKPASELVALEERIRLLEEAHTRHESEIAAMSEAQQFTTQLLTDRAIKQLNCSVRLPRRRQSRRRGADPRHAGRQP
jgi:hypothetical protein